MVVFSDGRQAKNSTCTTDTKLRLPPKEMWNYEFNGFSFDTFSTSIGRIHPKRTI